jgi:hypothetical protein
LLFRDGFVGAASDVLFWRKQGMTRNVFLEPEADLVTDAAKAALMTRK